MNFKELRDLSQKHELRIDDHEDFKRTPPYYYDSLRHAFGFYFNTFLTSNSRYEYYADGTADRDVLDEDNTVLTIVAFQRFFELFIKDLLRRVNPMLFLKSTRGIKETDHIEGEGEFLKNKDTLTFGATLSKFYELMDKSKRDDFGSDSMLVKFRGIIRDYAFMDSVIHESSLRYLGWWRDKIVHKGNSLPGLKLLDYLITQRLLPIVNEIAKVDHAKLNDSLFYLETVTKISIVNELMKVKFGMDDGNKRETFNSLLKIGHLKELGRASLNMNQFMRSNHASYEYNYRDVMGRGVRFAEAERAHSHFKKVISCPCCGVKSLVYYREVIADMFKPESTKNIDWVKCYTCDYHLRYNVGDLSIWNEDFRKIFSEE